MVLANRMLAVALSCRQGWAALFTGVIMFVEFLANTSQVTLISTWIVD
jgi:hypothetical protein